MRIFGGIYLNEDGLNTSVRGMDVQASLLSTASQNIRGFDKVGYQKKVPVVSSFVEILGRHALSSVVDTAPGRINFTDNPLDLSIAKSGYFQYKTDSGIELTRDGRFQFDKDGYLLTLGNHKVLSVTGEPIKFDKVPSDVSNVKVMQNGQILLQDSITKKLTEIDKISVVSQDGTLIDEVDIKQGYVEASNVALHSELFNMAPTRRNFEANRQMFLTQNDILSQTIQKLGSTS